MKTEVLPTFPPAQHYIGDLLERDASAGGRYGGNGFVDGGCLPLLASQNLAG